MNNQVGGQRGKSQGLAAKTSERGPRLGAETRTNEFFEKLELAERELTSVEKDCNAVLYSRRSEFRRDYCTLEDLEVKAGNERKNEKQQLRHQLGRIRGNVNKFQRELTDVKPSPAFVEKLKELMEEIEGSIMSFKEQQRKNYDELLQEEKTISKEVCSVEKKLESWSQLPPPTTTAVSVKKASNTVTASLPPAVAAFERFLLQTGGHQGGWDDYDHNVFLKLKAKHKTKDAFLSMSGSAFPGKSADDARQHYDWYTEYMTLKESKKTAIQEWKHIKESEKQEGLEKVETELEEDEAKKQKKGEQYEKERAERIAKLSDYKVQRKLEQAKREEQRLKQQIQKAKEKEKEEQRRLELKAQVEEYARRRTEEEEVIKLAQQTREAQQRMTKRPSSADMARVQERNMKMLEEKQSKIKSKEVEKEERQKRLQKLKSQVEVKAERDPSRLYKLTRGWEERRKEEAKGSGGPVLHMPHRAVPSWRQGLS